MPTVTTVLGPVEAGALGSVLAAETLLCAPPQRLGNAGVPASEAEFERVAVGMPMLGRLMLGAVNTDDRTIEADAAEAAVDELAAAAGTETGRSAALVALAGQGSTAEPAALACLSRASGVAIVRGTDGGIGSGSGSRSAGSSPSGAPGDGASDPGPLDPDAVGRRIAAELRATEHPAGVVGAIPLPLDARAGGAARPRSPGVSASPEAAELTDADRALALLVAAARAASAAGAALVVSPRPDPWEVAPPHAAGDATLAALERALDAVDAAGLDRSCVVLLGAAGVIADAAGTGVDHGRLDALLGLGTAICFDQLGRIPNVRTVVSDHDLAAAILHSAAAGAAHRVLLSSGIRNKHRLTAYGGNGLEFVATQFLPYLRMMGADDELVAAVGGGNASRVLARATDEGAGE